MTRLPTLDRLEQQTRQQSSRRLAPATVLALIEAVRASKSYWQQSLPYPDDDEARQADLAYRAALARFADDDCPVHQDPSQSQAATKEETP